MLLFQIIILGSESSYFTVYVSFFILDHNLFIADIDKRIIKYDKYISQSTRNIYKEYRDNYTNNRSNFNIKRSFNNFRDNILSYNVSLRYQLGYPQANLFEIYNSYNVNDKINFHFALSYVLMYLIILIYDYYKSEELYYIIGILVIYFSVSLLLKVFIVVIKWINKIFSKIKTRKAPRHIDAFNNKNPRSINNEKIRY